uniref:Uncharacterized protein n=1 Tax=Ochrobactrum phage ORM_20 TaxID=2985243 RepID=A0A9N6ZG42_9VIRU|nr:hypothetical protein ORM20_00216 [Ochrobactrum phage ORM_20]
MTKNLIKKSTFFQDFVQDLEIGPVDNPGDLSIAAYDQFDLDNFIEAVEYSWKDEKTITVKVPAHQVKRFERGQMYLTVIAIQNGNVTNPVNCQVDLSR